MAEASGGAPVGADVGGDAGGDAADVPAQGAQPTPAQARKVRLLLGGKEQELDESHVLTNYQKGLNASQLLSKVEQKRQEALKKLAQAEGLIGRAKKDPLVFLRELGVDTAEMSQREILDAIRLEQMTPEQRRLHEMEKKIRGHEEEKQKAEEEKQKAAHAAEVEQHKDTLASLFLETMERTGLPKSSGRFVISRMASLYAQNEQAGLESTPDEMAEHVLAGLKAEQQGMLGGLEGEALLSHLGPEVVTKVLQANLARVRQKKGVSGVTQQQAPVPRAAAKPPAGLQRGDPDFFRRLKEG